MTAQGENHPDNKKDGLIQVSIGSLLLATMPLGILAALSWWIGLVDISTSIMTGCLRTLLQLTLLGTVLRPIFAMGNPFVVVLYALFMVVLAAQESSSRTKYQFENQFGYILTSLIINVGWVGLFGFVGIIRPRPLWNPRYVIPIVGMLLGNSISAVSLSLNSITTALVERQAEIELYLSFGASRYEAVSRLVLNGIQTGATPSMNMMRVVGIISIPGMMTGQILGGSPALVAARYQMLIIYLIASCTLSVILMNAWVAVGVGFDEHQVLRTDRFTENKRLGVLSMIMMLLGRATDVSLLGNGGGNIVGFYKHESSAMKKTDVNHIVVPPKDVLEIRALKESCPSIPTEDEKLDVVGLGRSFIVHEETQTLQQVLFEDVSFEVSPGDLLLVRGPSGVGKSTLLRTIAGLGPLEEGTVLYAGHPWEVHGGQQWRRNIRYVAQTKVDIPGTPRDFLNRITSFASWKESGSDASSSPENVLQPTLDYIVKWGMKADSLDKEWGMLSGGEAQRVIVAMAMASNPKILLLDEATSGLDLPTKFLLEESVKDFVHNHVGGVLWVSHDSQQAERMSLYANNEEREEALEQHSAHVST